MLDAGLYVVATPIGNLEGIALRALRILANVEIIAAEDTRRTGRLLQNHGISNRLQSFHEHNETQRIPGLLDLINKGLAVAVVSDAGTPLVSDPGFRLVRAAHEADLPVFAIPGASALTAALSVCGISTDHFCFSGFLPGKAGARRTRLKELSVSVETQVIFESSHRVLDCLTDMVEIMGPERRVSVCRELTKTFETVLTGQLGAVLEKVNSDSDQQKGEFVIVIEGTSISESDVSGLKLAKALHEELPASQAARIAAKISGGKRRELYAALERSED